MKAKLVVALALICGLTGCRDPGADAESQLEAGRPDPVENVQGAMDAQTRSGEMRAAESLQRPLPGRISELPFPYHLNLDRDTGASRNGKQAREIGIELLGPTALAAEADFSALVAQQGGAIQQRQERGEAVRVVYSLPDGTAMLAWFRPGAPAGERYALQRRDASGTLYLAWPYVDKGAQ